jgi:hypothetical protein
MLKPAESAVILLMAAVITWCLLVAAFPPEPEPTKRPPTLSETEEVEDHNVRLSDGRRVTCVSSAHGISCDWDHAREAPTQ